MLSVDIAERAWGPIDDHAPPEHDVECPYCGLNQTVQARARNDLITCVRCKSRLEHGTGTYPDAALACALGALLLLIPAWSLPFLTTSALGSTVSSQLWSSITILWRDGQPLVSIVVCLFILVFPIIRLLSLSAVLIALRAAARPPWLPLAFRVCNGLQTWAMLDVFLLGLMVAYARLRATIPTTIDGGAILFMASILLGLGARASLDKVAVWHMIGREHRRPELQGAIGCLSCGLLVSRVREGHDCPRCGAVVRARKNHSYSRSLALLAALLMYFPANLYPIAVIPIGLTPTSYTVLGGVVDLFDSHLWGLGLLVFTASFTIPLLKMICLAWCIASALQRHPQRLVAKTRVYRIIEEVGRWSMVDPLTIACFVPVLQFNGLIAGSAQAAATPFTAVVILTTLAVKAFDPRLMWDATVGTS